MLYIGWHDRFAERAAGVLGVRGGGWGGGGQASSAGTANGNKGKGSAGGSGGSKPGPLSGVSLSGVDNSVPAAESGIVGAMFGDMGARQFQSTENSNVSTESLLDPTGWSEDPSDPNSPTIERVTRSEPFAPSGPNERWGTTFGTAPDVQQQQDQYNSAWDALQNRGLGGWLRDHLLNALPGFRQEEPNWNEPSTYADGTYHDSWSPLGAISSVLGMASPIPGTSLATGYAGNELADAAGAERYVFGDEGGWGAPVAEPGPTTGPKQQAKDAQLAALKGPVLGGKGNAGGSQIFQFSDVLKNKQPAPVSVNPTPSAYENLTTYYSDGSPKTTALSPIYY